MTNLPIPPSVTSEQAFDWYINGLATYSELVEVLDSRTGLKTHRSYESLNSYLRSWHLGFGEYGLSYQTFIYWMYDTKIPSEPVDINSYYANLSQEKLLQEITDMERDRDANFEMAESARNGALFYSEPWAYEAEAKDLQEYIDMARRYVK